jgi:methylated-DNA-[protein]-cysteine S-methyltransferase
MRKPPTSNQLRQEIGGYLACASHHTDAGWVQVWASEAGIVALAWPLAEAPDNCAGGSEPAQRWAGLAVAQVVEYLSGARREFTVPIDWRGVSDFSRQVLESCARIPYGQTQTYGELAAAAGRPRAARAVGQALAHNRLPLILPCHRILAAEGGLGGFGLGLEIKRRLLDLEKLSKVVA